ncbi:nucleolar complex protein 4 homolog B isoform X2 [Octopus sinensis]|uniref:Nucleolar complex protein 4 homolog B isoform X2 n=1 Tax=Octopus sinensis TaxID=2607531 RepID=A0A6P7TCI5_9MOLL|nr:nucleolar complex protein 4 homolog B isoform X2 [Octopus sinensis]
MTSVNVPSKKKSKKKANLNTNTATEKISPKILNTDENIQELLKSKSSSFENENVRLNFLGHIVNILTSKNQEKCSSDGNIFCCLELIMTEFLKASKSENSNENKAEKRLLNKSLLTFLQKKLTFGLYKRVLVSVTDVISCLEAPLQLSDFLFNSFKMGGSVSLLSLNGIFILMDKHNLNYPDFYKKLYSLLDPAIFHSNTEQTFSAT